MIFLNTAYKILMMKKIYNKSREESPGSWQWSNNFAANQNSISSFANDLHSILNFMNSHRTHTHTHTHTKLKCMHERNFKKKG